MAINKIVYYSPDRRIRITADTRNSAYRIERDMVFVATFTGLPLLQRWLNENGLDLADLIED